MTDETTEPWYADYVDRKVAEFAAGLGPDTDQVTQDAARALVHTVMRDMTIHLGHQRTAAQ